MPSFIPATGITLHLEGECVNRIGVVRTMARHRTAGAGSGWSRTRLTPARRGRDAFRASCREPRGRLCGSARTQGVGVTLGGLGLVIHGDDEHSTWIPPKVVQVVSTHGAGDCFVGTLAARLPRAIRCSGLHNRPMPLPRISSAPQQAPEGAEFR